MFFFLTFFWLVQIKPAGMRTRPFKPRRRRDGDVAAAETLAEPYTQKTIKHHKYGSMSQTAF